MFTDREHCLKTDAHVAAHLGLGVLVRQVRDQARSLREECDELPRMCDALNGSPRMLIGES